MTEKQEKILTKSIEKAVENGWLDLLDDLLMEYFVDFVDNLIIISGAYKRHEFNSVDEIIFNHDFARAFWGEAIYNRWNRYTGEDYRGIEWQYQIQDMAALPDNKRIQFLKKFL